MEWEPEMEFQGRQQLANALDLSSRLAQKEQTNQQKQLKQSSLFNALCDQESRHENRDDNHEPEEDWKQYLVSFFFIKNGVSNLCPLANQIQLEYIPDNVK